MTGYRIGNDMTILWSINDRTGAALPLNDKEVHLYYTCERGRFEADIEIQDQNVVVWRFMGKQQRCLGGYTLTLVIISEGKRTIKKDYCNAFTLVGRGCRERFEKDAHISEGGELTLASELDIYRIYPVIPVVGPNSNWWVDGEDTGDPSTGMSAYEYALTKGFEGTEEKFAELLAQTPELSIRMDGTQRKINVSLITSNNDAIPNIDTSARTLDLGSDPILLVGNKSYALKSIHPDTSAYRAISLEDVEGTGTSAVKLVFNLTSQKMYARQWGAVLADDEVLVGGVRKDNANGWKYNLPFDFTIDGKGGQMQVVANQKHISDNTDSIVNIEQAIFPYVTESHKPEYTIAYQDYQILNGSLSSQAGYVVTAPIPLKRGDILNLTCYVGGTAQAISLTDAEGSYYTAISSGNGYAERVYTVTEDCYVALSWLVLNEYPVILSVNGSSYIPMIKARLDDLESITIPAIQEDIEDLRNPTSGVTGNGVYVSLISSLDSAIPNISTSARTLDLGVDPILLVGGQSYLMKSIHSDTSAYRAISLEDVEGTGTSAVKLVFNTTSKTIYARIWDAELSSDEVLVGGIRKNYTSEWECNLPFDFTIDGKSNTPSVSVAGGKDNVSLITSLNDAIPNIDTKSKLF